MHSIHNDTINTEPDNKNNWLNKNIPIREKQCIVTKKRRTINQFLWVCVFSNTLQIHSTHLYAYVDGTVQYK